MVVCFLRPSFSLSFGLAKQVLLLPVLSMSVGPSGLEAFYSILSAINKNRTHCCAAFQFPGSLGSPPTTFYLLKSSCAYFVCFFPEFLIVSRRTWKWRWGYSILARTGSLHTNFDRLQLAYKILKIVAITVYIYISGCEILKHFGRSLFILG